MALAGFYLLPLAVGDSANYLYYHGEVRIKLELECLFCVVSFALLHLRCFICVASSALLHLRYFIWPNFCEWTTTIHLETDFFQFLKKKIWSASWSCLNSSSIYFSFSYHIYVCSNKPFWHLVIWERFESEFSASGCDRINYSADIVTYETKSATRSRQRNEQKLLGFARSYWRSMIQGW